MYGILGHIVSDLSVDSANPNYQPGISDQYPTTYYEGNCNSVPVDLDRICRDYATDCIANFKPLEPIRVQVGLHGHNGQLLSSLFMRESLGLLNFN